MCVWSGVFGRPVASIFEGGVFFVDCEYWSFQNVFTLDLGHFQHSNSK